MLHLLLFFAHLSISLDFKGKADTFSPHLCHHKFYFTKYYHISSKAHNKCNKNRIFKHL